MIYPTYPAYKSHPTSPTFHAGYEYLLAYKITVPVYDYTVEFCNRCSSYHPTSLTFPPLSSPRTYDQMIQASRSGMTNIPEGSKQKSLATYIKLAGVSRGSIEELLNDYLSYARQHQIVIWEKDRVRREIRESGEIWDTLNNTSFLPTSPTFPSLPVSPEKAVNLLIDLCRTAGYLQDKLIKSLEAKHRTEGGYNENLLKKRLAEKSKKLVLSHY